MKKLLMIAFALLMTLQLNAQDKLYLVFEFMKVDNKQEAAYADTEEFWAKIHEQRVINGDIIGWDLWRLQPGGEDQHFQYLTVNLYNDPVKMMSGAGDFNAAVKAAYPNMSEEDLEKHMTMTSKSRDLAVRVYLEEIDATTGDFSMELGTIAAINMMKVAPENVEKYEKMESEIFKPMHQRDVDNGVRGSWGLLRFMSPYGSDAYATHITVDMYKDYNQFFNPPEVAEESAPTEAQMKQINEGIASRDHRFMYLATLIKTHKK
jgi:hypothetical protein